MRLKLIGLIWPLSGFRWRQVLREASVSSQIGFVTCARTCNPSSSCQPRHVAASAFSRIHLPRQYQVDQDAVEPTFRPPVISSRLFLCSIVQTVFFQGMPARGHRGPKEKSFALGKVWASVAAMKSIFTERSKLRGPYFQTLPHILNSGETLYFIP